MFAVACTNQSFVSPQSYFNQANVFAKKGDYHNANQFFKKAIGIDPKNGCAYNNLAWLQSACPVSDYRNGEAAVKNALIGCELTAPKNSRHYAGHLDTLACAYAEAGDFTQAIKWSKQALAMVDSIDKEKFRARLALYAQNKAYRDP